MELWILSCGIYDVHNGYGCHKHQIAETDQKQSAGHVVLSLQNIATILFTEIWKICLMDVFGVDLSLELTWFSVGILPSSLRNTR